MKNLRFFLNLCPSCEGLSYMDSGVKRSSRQCRLADCTKKFVQVAFVRWRGDSKIVEANAEHDFCLKRLIGMLRTTNSKTSFAAPFFCAICQAALPGRPFDTRILYAKKAFNSSPLLSGCCQMPVPAQRPVYFFRE